MDDDDDDDDDDNNYDEATKMTVSEKFHFSRDPNFRWLIVSNRVQKIR